MVQPTMPISTVERASFHYTVENITEVKQHIIEFLKHPMFSHSLYHTKFKVGKQKAKKIDFTKVWVFNNMMENKGRK